MWLLVVPALTLGGLIAWYKPWREHFPGADAYYDRRELEAQARLEAVRVTTWHALRVQVPGDFGLLTGAPRLEVLDLTPPGDSSATWPTQMVFLSLDSSAVNRFVAAAGNCSLSADRCWTDSTGPVRFDCERSSGVPDPDISWTPHVECQSPLRSVRALINAPPGQTLELLDVFRNAVAGTCADSAMRAHFALTLPPCPADGR